MRKRTIPLVLGTAFALAFTMSGPAHAAESSEWKSLSCTSGGAKGELDYRWWVPSTTGEIDLGLTAYDIAADGHHPEVRFVSHNYAGTVKYWPWRSYTGGSPGGRTWYTTAQSSAGLYGIGIQVANKEGSEIISYRTCWVPEPA
ncbi:hypothetical protein ACIQWZ_15700 [Streptomyces sp. NPDC098077]|uniref:hypothetical protein n=1 Tax=unclassified Streptomyces TaxID=2593676 RepID=UPI0037F41585